MTEDTARPMWMVRAGRGASRLDEFLTGHVAIAFGGESIGPIAQGDARAEVIERYRKTYPSWRDGKAVNAAGQVHRFHREVQTGDAVITYDPETRRYLLGAFTGPAEFQGGDSGNAPYQRPVKWSRKVARDSLSVGTRNSLGSTLTLFRIPDEAAAEMRAASQPLDAVDPEPPEPPDTTNGDEPSLENLRQEMVDKAGEFIEDLLAALDPYEMQDLIAGVLRAMGYKTRVSPKGADRGVDIFASPDGLGLQEPRIFVEVKHRKTTAMGSPDLRSFLGGRQQGDRCLYVSTGGFSKDARYEAERSSVPLTLIDLPALRELVVEHYEQLDPEVRQLVPLTRLYWPVGDNS